MKTKHPLNSIQMSSSFLVPYVRWGELNVGWGELRVASAQFTEFKTAVIENIQSTLTKENGVLEFQAVIKQEHPNELCVFEVYKDKEAYRTHIQSLHYKQFGASVGPIIKNKALYDVIPVVLGRKQHAFRSAYVRIAELEIYPEYFEGYQKAVTEEIEISISSEPEVLAIYSVALKDSPAHLRFLEFYANEQAYLQHRESVHFQNYLAITKSMIKSRKLFEAESIMPGFKSIKG
ncbi:antibiotic biosynthesis monooxygenase [uncultured Tolumonas sp.]|uniref:putative quinol monooxygenase n=1 Tax=uncultured Tolumonas sp. TaxID=263765 RepID=UPI002A0A21E7|nr:antibiotic biosynthesis monooxygenase [uncultured Tolumonas sp.]